MMDQNALPPAPPGAPPQTGVGAPMTGGGAPQSPVPPPAQDQDQDQSQGAPQRGAPPTSGDAASGPAGPPGLPPMPQRSTEVTLDQVMALMRNDRMRGFRLDIETDSTVEPDENEYKQRLAEFMTAVGTFVEKVLPAGEAHPEMVPFLGEAMLTVVRGFRVGRQLEGAIEDAVAQIEEKSANSGGPPPNPEMAKAQADFAAKQAEIEANKQIEQARQQGETQRHAMTIAAQRQTAQENDRREQLRMITEAHGHQQTIEAKQQEALLQDDRERKKLEHEQNMGAATLAQKQMDRQAEDTRHYLSLTSQDQKASADRNHQRTMAREAAGQTAVDEQTGEPNPDPVLEALKALAEGQKTLAAAMEKMSKPKKVLRDKDGRLSGVE